MDGGVDLFQLLDADLCVNLRRAQLGVSQELQDEPDVGPAFQHQGCAGLAAQMAGAPFAQVGGIDVLSEHLFFGNIFS